MFVLRPDGKWVDFNCYACQGRPEVMDELVFNTTAEVMQIMARLTGKPEVVDLPIDEAGLKAWICTAGGRRSGASRASMGAAIPGTPSSAEKEMTSVNSSTRPNDDVVHLAEPNIDHYDQTKTHQTVHRRPWLQG